MLNDNEILLLTGELQPGLSREAAVATLSQVLRINVEWGTSFRICEALCAAGIGVRTHQMIAAEVAHATGDLERAAKLRSYYASPAFRHQHGITRAAWSSGPTVLPQKGETMFGNRKSVLETPADEVSIG